MSNKPTRLSDIERCLDIVAGGIAALKPKADLSLSDTAISQVLVLAQATQQQGLNEAYQVARSLACFLESLRQRRVDEQDIQQLQLLLDNLRRELHCPQTNALPAAPTVLVAPVPPSNLNRNPRIALYVESRAIMALLQETLSRAGFSPRILHSMQDLASLDEHDYPAAVVADLSLCRRDAETRAAITALRERFSTPVHLFCMASGDDTASRLEAVRLGATRFLKKPVDANRLVAILKGVTARTPVDNFRVIFVDDDRSLGAFYEAAMQDINVEVRTTQNPLATPALVAEFQPDVIVTDMYMPGCNGLELAALLRQDDSLADTPILFLSSEVNIHRQMKALDLGGDDFLTKPVPLEVLQAAVIARAKRARMLKRTRRDHQRIADHLQRIELAINKHSIVSIGDTDGTILYANQKFCEISGYTINEMLGANHRILKSGAHPPEFYQDLWRTISGGRTWHGEICNRRRDGSLYWVNATITPQFNEVGQPIRYVSVRTDVTPLKSLHTQLQAAKADLAKMQQINMDTLSRVIQELKMVLTDVKALSKLSSTENGATLSGADHTTLAQTIAGVSAHLFELLKELTSNEPKQ